MLKILPTTSVLSLCTVTLYNSKKRLMPEAARNCDSSTLNRLTWVISALKLSANPSKLIIKLYVNFNPKNPRAFPPDPQTSRKKAKHKK